MSVLYRGLIYIFGIILIIFSVDPNDNESFNPSRFIIGILLELICIIELIINNPNEWLAFKILFIISSSSFFIIPALTETKYGKLYINDNNSTLWFIVWLISAMSVIVALMYGLIFEPIIKHIDSESVSKIEILSINDAYEVYGKGNRSSFVIGEQGVYRFYYKTDTGLKKQDSIEFYNTYIDDTLPDNMQPYLEKLRSYDIVYGTYNKKTTESIINEKEWYVFHIPHGSIIESYELDLR